MAYQQQPQMGQPQMFPQQPQMVPQMGGVPQMAPQMGAVPQQMGAFPQQMGAVPMGAVPQQMGAVPQQMGAVPQMPQQMGAVGMVQQQEIVEITIKTVKVPNEQLKGKNVRVQVLHKRNKNQVGQPIVSNNATVKDGLVTFDFPCTVQNVCQGDKITFELQHADPASQGRIDHFDLKNPLEYNNNPGKNLFKCKNDKRNEFEIKIGVEQPLIVSVMSARVKGLDGKDVKIHVIQKRDGKEVSEKALKSATVRDGLVTWNDIYKIPHVGKTDKIVFELKYTDPKENANIRRIEYLNLKAAECLQKALQPCETSFPCKNNTQNQFTIKIALPEPLKILEEPLKIHVGSCDIKTLKEGDWVKLCVYHKRSGETIYEKEGFGKKIDTWKSARFYMDLIIRNVDATDEIVFKIVTTKDSKQVDIKTMKVSECLEYCRKQPKQYYIKCETRGDKNELSIKFTMDGLTPAAVQHRRRNGNANGGCCIIS